MQLQQHMQRRRACSRPSPGAPTHSTPPRRPQLADKQQDLVRVQRSASFNSINIQASASVHSAHVLCEDESPLAGALPLPLDTAPLKGGDGCDRLLEYRCGRYLFHHGQAAFLPVPPLPADFPASLAAVAGSRNIKGARCCARAFKPLLGAAAGAVVAWQRCCGGWCCSACAAAMPAQPPPPLFPAPAGQLMDDFDRGERRVLYGANELVIPVKPPLALMAEEMIHPFFIFQYASVTIW